MCDVGSKDASLIVQQAFCAHPACVLDKVMSAEMISSNLFGTIGVVQDYAIKSQSRVSKILPCLLKQRGGVCPVEHSAVFHLNAIKHRSHPWRMVRWKGDDRVWTGCETLKWLNFVDF